MNRYLKLLIRNNSHLFSKSEDILAKYFLELSDELVNKTIAKLSNETGVSQTTIFNFVKKLGFEGFQDFKITLAAHTSTDEIPDNSLAIYSDVSQGDTFEEMAHKVIQFNQLSLNILKDTLEIERITHIIELIKNKQNLYFLGQGGSSVVAYDAYHKFLRTKYSCNYIHDYHFQLITATKLTKKDIVFLFSHSGMTIETLNLAKQIAKTEAVVITLTGNPGSELMNYSDETIIVISDEAQFRAESLTSRILYLTVMDIIYTIVMYSDEEINMQSFDKIRGAISVTRNT
ncbi:RpiR family phosphosugar-binding transcriptional regulator [Suicoccus acidiformans]|uniref:RpiR family phosphosugar-binding transcriptional regulator n=1 Tax=Suicoccus acidiformans TaxID=2036206 RepID=A0A347WIH7_9LACT|nr:MurR/RpiR family transcriptional regulator [Suicoccus acidiformans]AXY24884.1 RpiR family phosphosugar-binding transcriptional regulator [Suicoccus acidiformans]